MATSRELTEAILAVCPISGIAIGNRADKSTWRIDFAPEATDEQRAAAQAVVDAFDFNAPSVPESVHMWQAKAALAAAGLLDVANQAVQGSGNTQIQLAWQYAPEISRSSPAVAAIGAAIGLSSTSALDQLFIAAEAITV